MAPRSARNGGTPQASDDLGLLALRAAIQLSRLLEGHADARDRIDAFVGVLKQTPGIGSAADTRQLAANPQAVALFNRALGAISKQRIDFTRDFFDRMSRLVEELDSADPTKRNDAQQQMRDFCLALHSKLLADRASSQEHETLLPEGALRLAAP